MTGTVPRSTVLTLGFVIVSLMFIAGITGYVLGNRQQTDSIVAEATPEPAPTTYLIPPIRDEKRLAVYCGIQQVRGYSASFILTGGEALPVYALDAFGLVVQDLTVNEIYEFTVRHDNYQLYVIRIDAAPADSQSSELGPCPIE